jgi:hypothetical protein
MAKSQTTMRDEQHELTRRALIKWTVAAGAALGVSRSKVFEVLEKTAGKGIAQAAAAQKTNFSVHLMAGGGGAAWFQLSWPQNFVAQANNPNFAWEHAGNTTLIQGTDKPMYKGPTTIWSDLPAARQVTLFQAGRDQTHVSDADSVTDLNGSNIFSIGTALQAAVPVVIPAVAIDGVDYGTAPGAARPAQVNNIDGLVGLFNSAASRAGGLLSMSKDATLYAAHFNAYAQLNRASGRSTQRSAYLTAQSAAQFLGRNLEAQLRVAPEDLTKYGVNGGMDASTAALARSFIVITKAFRMGLTASVAMPAFLNQDPHGAFDGGTSRTRPPQHKIVFDAWMKDLTDTVNEATLQSLADTTVITITGDTFKSAFNRGGWPDGQTNGSNTIIVYSAGHLKSGWFGGVTGPNAVSGFNANGDPAPYDQVQTARLANAAIAYAIAQRDERAISQFANGITISGKLGRILDQ